ncbi:MAG: hypothetical protein EOO14_06920 [Chitinophagaceae bacterium]|nr:MAG: hypothetical protein EOO14_06920 [Chitinophagaceae bacterium]
MKIAAGLLTLLSLLTVGANAQTKKPATHQCTPGDACCSQDKTKVPPVNTKTTLPMTAAVKSKQVACKLTTPALRKRKEEVIAVLKNKVREKTELQDGYRFTFEGSDAMMDTLVDFIKTERQCCNFFTFNLTVSDDESSHLLSLTGPDGAKEFIVSELNL